ncbi:hypothetical protein DICVIV_03012 [Dictyocaulus viviparus]|uniref:Uncharacterized protein n=1 Tax=Dictyocaulus viviparus TaxID=29172 RepID=A0A0D8Y3V3_DICVI|nr:hypothetical protein DICVIV_03012 [Dictyocaulus viviparus]
MTSLKRSSTFNEAMLTHCKKFQLKFDLNNNKVYCIPSCKPYYKRVNELFCTHFTFISTSGCQSNSIIDCPLLIYNSLLQ